LAWQWFFWAWHCQFLAGHLPSRLLWVTCSVGLGLTHNMVGLKDNILFLLNHIPHPLLIKLCKPQTHLNCYGLVAHQTLNLASVLCKLHDTVCLHYSVTCYTIWHYAIGSYPVWKTVDLLQEKLRNIGSNHWKHLLILHVIKFWSSEISFYWNATYYHWTRFCMICTIWP